MYSNIILMIPPPPPNQVISFEEEPIRIEDFYIDISIIFVLVIYLIISKVINPNKKNNNN